MDLNRLYYFVSVAECGSFTKAGQKLSLPKSTLSRQVKSLEDELQIRLLNRSTRKLSLTIAGEKLYRESLPLVTSLQNVQSEITDFRDHVKGQLRVTTAPEIGYSLLSVILPEFMSRHPEIQFEFEFSTAKKDLINEGFDLALRIGELEDSTYVAKRIGYPALSLYASPNYLLANGDPKTLNDLDHHKHIVMTFSNGKLFLEDQSEPYIRQNYRITSNSMTFNASMCLQGQGIALLPDAIVEEEVKQGQLLRILPDLQLARPPIYAVYPSRNHPSKALKTFIEFLSSEIVKFRKLND